ncbi:hypothetical protein [Lentzea terrae]|uniref:hypothetical protein n=1 Tax=Lentzea terrae TaxID=2200761 RepID=UPI000DD43210|nr:hypothetical protein [Lentzea terrae]
MTQENAGADAVLGAAAGLAGGAIGGAVSAFKAATSIMDRVAQAAGPSTQQFHVDKDTVLKAGKVIHDQWLMLEQAYLNVVPKLRINFNGDQVTADVVQAWNDRLVGERDDSYAARIGQYKDALKHLSDQLKASAEQYGLSDDDIKATFRPKA